MNKFTEGFEKFKRVGVGEPPTLEELKKKIGATAMNKEMTWTEVKRFYEKELLNNKNITRQDLKELEALYKKTVKSIHGTKFEKRDNVVQSFGLFVRDKLAETAGKINFIDVLSLYVESDKVDDFAFERIEKEVGLEERLESLYNKMLENYKKAKPL